MVFSPLAIFEKHKPNYRMFFSKLKEYNKLAKAFNGLYPMVDNLFLTMGGDDFVTDLYTAAYIGRREITSKMEKYNWNMNGKIVVPMIPKNNLTLSSAYEETIGKLITISKAIGCYSDVKEILDGGELYTEFEQNLPEHIKRTL